MEEFVLKEVAFEHPKAGFANKVCKLLYDKHDGDLNKAIKELKQSGLYYDFHQHVKNIHEITCSHIPMFRYLELMEYSKDNWNYTQEEYVQAIEDAIAACHNYYK